MKCRECNSCRKGWFKSKPEDYVCIGVPEPFLINNIDGECTEYRENKNNFFYDTMQGLLEAVAIEYKTMQKEEKGISDRLYIGVDFALDDDETLVVMRRKGDDTYVINQFRNDEAVELYNKLIGVKDELCLKDGLVQEFSL